MALFCLHCTSARVQGRTRRFLGMRSACARTPSLSTMPGVYKQVLVTAVDSRGCTAAGRRLVIFACEMVYLRGRRRVIARSHCELATASRRAIPGRWTSVAVFHNRETSLTSLLHYEKGDSINIVKNIMPTDTCVLCNRPDGAVRRRAAPYNTYKCPASRATHVLLCVNKLRWFVDESVKHTF